jgi:hypothetical protein
VVVTLALAVAKIDVGAQAAAATGVLGVAVMVWLLVATGYARLSLPAPLIPVRREPRRHPEWRVARCRSGVQVRPSAQHVEGTRSHAGGRTMR